MQEYLDHLNEQRWCMVRHINGKGLEVSRNKFNVLPKAIKIIEEDDPVAYKDYARFVCADLESPIEVEDDSLDFVFITMDYIPETMRLAYLSKLKVGGRLIMHHLVKKEYDFSISIKTAAKSFKFYRPDPLPEKNVGILRLGAAGDLLQTASVAKALKADGYHVTVYAQLPTSSVLHNNPNIDQLIETDRDIVRNQELRPYWDWLETQHQKFVNLAGSVEASWLPNAHDPRFHWPTRIRNQYLNKNYVEFMHEMADVKYKLDVEFFPTDDEIKWAKAERATMKGKKIVCYSLNGSSLHKCWPWMDVIFARIMLTMPDVEIVTLGDEYAEILESGWQDEPRVHKRAGKWTFRQSLTFVKMHSDLLIGPETGILNSACCQEFPKILFLSHSTKQNLSRDWKNTISLMSKFDDGCLHRLHMVSDGWKYMIRDEETGCAKSQALITADECWAHVERFLK